MVELIESPGKGLAGFFSGNVQVTGNVQKAGGGFKIDHPQDPATKYLSHSFVESSEMKNVYDGIVLLDATGCAVVDLPDWFQVLNRDFRYQSADVNVIWMRVKHQNSAALELPVAER